MSKSKSLIPPINDGESTSPIAPAYPTMVGAYGGYGPVGPPIIGAGEATIVGGATNDGDGACSIPLITTHSLHGSHLCSISHTS